MQSNLILGNYEVETALRKGPVFQWLKAKELSSGNPVLLQILCEKISSEHINALFDYFDHLCAASRNKLFLPDYTLSDHDTPLGVVYKYIAFESFSKALQKIPQQALEWWRTASEQLFYLHNRDLVHGYVSPQNLIVIGGDIFLFNFGYAPLLAAGHETALKAVGNYCAPEVKAKHSVTPKADIYAFAKTVGYFHPELQSTAWYKESTAKNPEKRLRRMRDDFKKLREVFTTEKSTEQDVETQEATIIAKYRLTTESKPKGRGKITGAGNYVESKHVQVNAIPAEECWFDHWEGDISGDENPATVIMDQDKHIVAVFKKETYHLDLQPSPLEGGEVVGSGKYAKNRRVEIKAIPAPGYTFKTWSGDVAGKSNPMKVKMNSQKTIIAHFSRCYTLKVTSAPLEGGEALGGGEYAENQKITITASPAQGYVFDHWEGDLRDKENPTTVLVDQDKNIVAAFKEETYHLDIQSSPLEGGNAFGSGHYPKNERVKISAFPSQDYVFDHWEGDVSSTKNPLTLTMDSNKKIVAVFVKTGEESISPGKKLILNVEIDPPQSGKVSANNEYVQATKQFTEGTTVNLKAEPANLWEWSFDRWSGDIEGHDNPISVEMDSGKTVTAHFEAGIWTTKFVLETKVEPKEGGQVKGGGKYQRGKVQMIEAIPNPDWEFSHWSGDAQGHDPKIRVTMDKQKMVIAHFVKKGQKSSSQGKKQPKSKIPPWAQ